MAKRKVDYVEIRDLMEFQPLELLQGLRTDLYVMWEDGVLTPMKSKEIALQRYLLDALKGFEKLPIVSKYLLSHYYTGGIYTSKTFHKVFEKIFADIANLVSRDKLPYLFRNMFEVYNRIYNEVIYNNLAYADSLAIEDFLEIQMDEDLLEALRVADRERSVEAVNNSYQVLDKIFTTKESIQNNPVTIGYNGRIYNPSQLKQTLACRGFITEISSLIFKHPIASSFVLGLHDIYSLAIESRAGAKALHLSTKAISDAEYFARESQLVTMYVEHLVDGDCGNHDYIDWYVHPGDEYHKPHLSKLLGKYYFDPVSGTEKVITENDTHLVGTNIKLRSVLNCKLEDKRCVCSKCFGKLANNIPLHANIGHYASVQLTEKISQSILSTKHLSGTAVGSHAQLTGYSAKFFNLKNNNWYLKKDVKNIKIAISQEEGFGIKDIGPTSDPKNLNPAWISKISNLIVLEEGEDESYVSYIVALGANTHGYLSSDILESIVKNGYKLDENDRYVIDLKNWLISKPIITIPEAEFNFLQFANAIKKEFKSLEIIDGDRSLYSPEKFLQMIFSLVNTKVEVNIAMLEVVVYAFTVMDMKKRNYDLGRNSHDKQLSPIEGIMTSRSMGGAYAWERQIGSMLSPLSFYQSSLATHPLDFLLKPIDHMLAHYGRVNLPVRHRDI